MILNILNKTITYKNDVAILNDVFDFINKSIKESNEFFSHLVVDDIEVFDNHDEYLVDRIANIKEIKVFTKTKNSLLIESAESTEIYLKAAIPEIKLLVEEFYDQPNEETWSKFSQLTEGLQWLIQLVYSLERLDEKLPNTEKYSSALKTMESELINLLEAVENDDVTLIGDIITYEILPSLEILQEATTETVDQVGSRKEAN